MNWRRGLLLAGINLLSAVPLICLLAARDAQFMKEQQESSANQLGLSIDRSGEIDAANTEIVEAQDEQTITFSPCGLWVHYAPQVYVVQFGNLPAFVLSQWQEICPPKWSIAGMFGVGMNGFSSNIQAKRRLDVAFCIMISLQWVMIGGFPLRQPARWWDEPGAWITASNFVAAWIAIIPVIDGLAKLPALIALVGWVWWFCLVIWKPVHLAWPSTLGRAQRLTP